MALAAGASLATLGVGCDSLFPSDGPPDPVNMKWTTYPVQLDSVGFLPGRVKTATVVPPGGTTFNVVRASDQSVAWSGQLTGPMNDPDTGGQLWIADFTAFDAPGTYTIQVPGNGDSPPFTIGSDVFADSLSAAMLGLTGARCGTSVSFTYGSDKFSHRTCHTHDANPRLLTGDTKIRPSLGGWHDAGDYGKYTTNAAFSVGILLEAWDHFKPTLSALSLQVPEHGGPIPDFLAEVKWELDWLLTTQIDDGSVSFKVTAFNFEGFVMPEDDGQARYYAPAGTGATADFVAVMAMASRIYRDYDEDFADTCKNAAKAGYAFLTANPQDIVPDESMFSTGTYQDGNDSDERLWAAAEMWEATSDPAALADFEKRAAKPAVAPGFDWPDVGNLGYFTYALSQQDGRNADVVAAVTASVTKSADTIAETAAGHMYGRGIPVYYWGSNGVVVRNAMNLWVARQLATDQASKDKYMDGIVHQIDYTLGRNPFGRSFVTGLGYHPPLHPHHRPSSSDNVQNPWPGMLVGGPQAGGTTDNGAPSWQDNEGTFQVNEVAINWTAAFIYAATALVQ